MAALFYIMLIGILEVGLVSVCGGMEMKIAKEDIMSVLNDIEGGVEGEPLWLKRPPPEGNTAKYRKRRFMDFPSSSTLIIDSKLVLPVTGLMNGITSTLAIKGDIDITLPDGGYTIGRSSSHNQTHLFTQLEKIIASMGYDGHACLLRTICEIAELPFGHGVLGEIVNFLFTVVAKNSWNELDSNGIPQDDYAAATFLGRKNGNCMDLYPSCPLSLTNLMSYVHYI